MTGLDRGTFSSAAGMSIKVLAPKDGESKRLTEWVEGGVYDAVRKGFLKTLIFGISKNMEGTDLLEVGQAMLANLVLVHHEQRANSVIMSHFLLCPLQEYMYNFSYGKDGNLQMMNMTNNKNALGSKLNVVPKVCGWSTL